MRSRHQRRKDLHLRNFDGGIDHDSWIRRMPCCVCGPRGQKTRTEAAHVTTRGADGKARDIVPLCSSHHQEQGDMGIASFQEHYLVDLEAVAAELWEQHQDEHAMGIEREVWT